jgi:hypothetical protein
MFNRFPHQASIKEWYRAQKTATYHTGAALKLLYIIIACPVTSCNDGGDCDDPHEGVTRV